MLKDKRDIFQKKKDFFLSEKGQQLISDKLNKFLIEVSKIVKRSNHNMHVPGVNSLNTKYLQCYIAMIGLS